LAVTKGNPGTGVGIFDPGNPSLVGVGGADSGGSMNSSVGEIRTVVGVGVFEVRVTVGDWRGVAEDGMFVVDWSNGVGNAIMIVPFSKYSKIK